MWKIDRVDDLDVEHLRTSNVPNACIVLVFLNVLYDFPSCADTHSPHWSRQDGKGDVFAHVILNLAIYIHHSVISR